MENLLQATTFWQQLGNCTPQVINLISQVSNRSFVTITNLNSRMTWWSERAVELFHLRESVSEFGKEQSNTEIHPDDVEHFKLAFKDRLNGRNIDIPIDYRIRGEEGTWNLISANCHYVGGDIENPSFLVCVFDNYRVNDRLDAVTGLYTGKTFSAELERLRNLDTQPVLVKIGVNKFSNINIIHGSDFGDKVLKRVAEILCDAFDNRVYRLIGAKFACILFDKDKEDVQRIYEKITHELADNIFIEGHKIPLKCSGAVLFLEGKEEDVKLTRSRLTLGLNYSKRFNHGKLTVFNEIFWNRGADDIKLIEAIYEAAVDFFQGFHMLYQPVADAETGEIKGMESLLRWKGDPFGICSPNVFIHWLEEDPCFFELGNWIIRRSLEDALKIMKKRPDFFVNVNIAPTQLERKEFRGALLEIIRELNFPPEKLCLELTERCRELDLNFLHQEAEFFRSQGIKVAIDDFGTGSASFKVALEVPADEIKIDMSFIQDIQNKPQKQAMVQAIIEYANQTDTKVCIEGVEDEETARYLSRYDVNWFQGYYYSEPIPLEQFLQIVG